mmetsp:Transcript_441/g.838  ORF Transcript_441/g.838 Transcript_441/m.838 type:complete len:81 (-) Transcript_441:127-369(-)
MDENVPQMTITDPKDVANDTTDSYGSSILHSCSVPGFGAVPESLKEEKSQRRRVTFAYLIKELPLFFWSCSFDVEVTTAR